MSRSTDPDKTTRVESLSISRAAAHYLASFLIIKLRYKTITRDFLGLGILIALMSGLNVLWPYLLRDLTNLLTKHPYSPDIRFNAIGLALAFSLSWLLANIATNLRGGVAASIMARCDSAFQAHLYEHLLKVNFEEFIKYSPGELSADIDNSRDGFSQLTYAIFVLVLPQIVQLLSILFILTSTVNLGFAILFSFSLGGAFLLSLRVAKGTQSRYESIIKASNTIRAHIVEQFNSILDIKANYAYASETATLASKLSTWTKAVTRANLFFSALNSLQSLILGVILVFSTVYLVAMVASGHFTA